MSAVLRTGKFLRYFAGITRNVVVNSVREHEGPNLLQTPCLCTQFQQNFASTAAPKPDVNLDKHFRRLDQDVRRIGRISRRDIEDVLEEIRVQRSATSSQSLLMIRCCGNLVPEEMPEVRTALVQEIWKTLIALNVPMDISHYNALLRVYLENEHPFSPTDFLAEIESKSIEPNRVTYQRLITRYCQQGDIEGATRILEFMREKNLPVNENVFNSLILGHAQANDMESAVGILAVMKQAGLEPSADTYTTLLCAYARVGDIDAITSTIEQCESNEISLLDKDFLDIIYALAINGFADKVDPVLAKLRLAFGFNQDAVNLILRLANKGQEDVGLKLLRIMPRSTRANGELVDAGSFLIKQLVKLNRPVDKILSVCKTLQDEGLNTKPLLIATEAGLTNGIVDSALPLLKEMKNAGLPIRQHYFWPLICSVKSNEVINVVRHMQEEFSLNPNSETLRDYVIPNLKEKNWNKIVNLLRDAGISNGTAVACAAHHALSELRIKDAAKIMESNKAYYLPQQFKQPLIVALDKTRDFDSFISIVRQIYEGVQARAGTSSNQQAERAVEESTEGEETDVAESEPAKAATPDVVGGILVEACNYFRRERAETLHRILIGLVEQGLSISNHNANVISERLGSEMTPELSELLGKLSSGELELTPRQSTPKRGLDELSIEELERFIANVEAKGESASNLKRSLLNACFRSKKLDKTLQVIEKLKSEKYTLHQSVWAQLIDLYTHHGNVAEALALYDKLKSEDATFVVDNIKTVRLADLLLKEDRLEDALKFLERNAKPALTIEGETASFNYVTTVWRTLNALAEAGDAQKLQRVFEALINGNYILPNNVVLGPLIKVHLVNDKIQQAIDTFELLCEKYKSTPWKNELACRLIQKEDAANLQRLTDLSTHIHGEINSLYDLVFSFVECGRIRQARKILETPGLRTRPYRIDSACERYKNEGMVQPLEGLIEATKDLSHIDRNKIYYNLLLSYCKSEDAEKALGLWTKMQEENIAPTDAFLIKLADLLRKHDIKVPFAVPSKTTKSAETSPPRQKEAAPVKSAKKSINGDLEKPKPSTTTNSNISLFRKAVRSGDLESALAHKDSLQPNETLTLTDVSNLIEQLLRNERLTEATQHVQEMLNNKTHPLPKVFKFYLNKIAAAGDVETIEKIGAQLSEEQKKLLSYDNRVCHANIVAGKVDQYFKRLDEQIDAVKSKEEAAKLAEKFPRGGALGILEKHPELVPEYEKLAEKYANFNQLGPINVLWMYLIASGNETHSKAIWDKHLSSAPRLMFQRVLQTARLQKDEKLAESVISQLRSSKISEGAIGNAYSCLLDIHIANNNADKALDTLKTALKDICLENINRTALVRLKDSLTKQNKEFPYSIPEKKGKGPMSSTSSSSSEDDVTPKTPETRPSKPKQTAE